MPFLPILFAEATHAVTSDTGDVQVQVCGSHVAIVPEQVSAAAGLLRFGRKGERVVPVQSGRADGPEPDDGGRPKLKATSKNLCRVGDEVGKILIPT